jgi:D-alanine-D-alanine ligase
MSPSESQGRRLRVAVLMGGTSAEREISLSTGRMILNALDPQKFSVTAIDTQDILILPAGGGATPPRLTETGTEEPDEQNAGGDATTAPLPVPLASSSRLTRTDGQKPDVVFIALHGRGGEDGSIQGMLELLGLPYTGSGVLASALAMDKTMSKRLFRAAGIPVIEDVQVRRGDEIGSALLCKVEERLGGFPVFVKPNAEGSTFGCTLVKSPDQLDEAVTLALRYDTLILIEKYVRGMEITVGVLETLDTPPGLQPLPVIEIIPKAEYYDYESKYAEGGSEHIIPARLPAALLRRAQEIAVQCHQALGCRGMSRTDMLVAGEQLFVLEVNTIPGMTPTSLLPQAAAHAGISFPVLLDRLIATALRREEPHVS